VTAPILFIILSLAYPSFEDVNSDPLQVLGFIIGHFLLVWVAFGLCMPSWFDVFIVPERRDDWKQPVAPGVLRETPEDRIAEGLESSSSDAVARKEESAANVDLGAGGGHPIDRRNSSDGLN
jgi:solute carrier family 6 GABA transporter-like protein 1